MMQRFVHEKLPFTGYPQLTNYSHLKNAVKMDLKTNNLAITSGRKENCHQPYENKKRLKIKMAI